MQPPAALDTLTTSGTSMIICRTSTKLRLMLIDDIKTLEFAEHELEEVRYGSETRRSSECRSEKKNTELHSWSQLLAVAATLSEVDPRVADENEMGGRLCRWRYIQGPSGLCNHRSESRTHLFSVSHMCTGRRLLANAVHCVSRSVKTALQGELESARCAIACACLVDASTAW